MLLFRRVLFRSDVAFQLELPQIEPTDDLSIYDEGLLTISNQNSNSIWFFFLDTQMMTYSSIPSISPNRSLLNFDSLEYFLVFFSMQKLKKTQIYPN